MPLLFLFLLGVGGGGYVVYRLLHDRERERPELARGSGSGDGIDAAFRGALRATPEQIVQATEREQAAAKERPAAPPAASASPGTTPAPPPKPAPERPLEIHEYHSRPPPKKAQGGAGSRFGDAARRAAEAAQSAPTTSGVDAPRSGRRRRS
ncbi:hypothetical protein [Polyangium mundeleinium]|uniref:Uncharacterized protein n=1 Tax=Polyangium mundeleinium TaxID=2995306 RepID=A0ABT5EEB0_9BACT|nr:hypothetical protein [Polyangium mundeleinium]MDC0740143.1 hypothetical protein [Polyangium mundeleinium]MDC0746689.1 hypothetical protein [Polyangium mundeleinium]